MQERDDCHDLVQHRMGMATEGGPMQT
jgi:hypothetical protein